MGCERFCSEHDSLWCIIDDSRVAEACKWHWVRIQSLQVTKSCEWAAMVDMRFMTQWRIHGPIQEACLHNQATIVLKLHVTGRIHWRPNSHSDPDGNSVTRYGSWGLEAARNPCPAVLDWPHTCQMWRRYHAREVVDKECRLMRTYMRGGYDDANRNSDHGKAQWKFAPLPTLPLNSFFATLSTIHTPNPPYPPVLIFYTHPYYLSLSIFHHTHCPPSLLSSFIPICQQSIPILSNLHTHLYSYPYSSYPTHHTHLHISSSLIPIFSH